MSQAALPSSLPASADGRSPPYQVVRGQIPPELLGQLARPFAERERRELFRRCNLSSAARVPRPERPRALWIFGPPAVGKSTMAEGASLEFFGASGNAVVVDGDDMREAHVGFQRVAEHGLRSGVVHADAWEIFKKAKITDELKKEMLRAAVGNRQNLLIPDAAISLERSREMLEQLTEAGYDLFAICMWAPEAQTQVRGTARAAETGKVFNPKTYRPAIDGALEMGRHWRAMVQKGSERYKAVAFYDSTARPSRPVDPAQFERLARLGAPRDASDTASSAAEETPGAAFCQARLPGCGSEQLTSSAVPKPCSGGAAAQQPPKARPSLMVAAANTAGPAAEETVQAAFCQARLPGCDSEHLTSSAVPKPCSGGAAAQQPPKARPSLMIAAANTAGPAAEETVQAAFCQARLPGCGSEHLTSSAMPEPCSGGDAAQQPPKARPSIMVAAAAAAAATISLKQSTATSSLSWPVSAHRARGFCGGAAWRQQRRRASRSFGAPFPCRERTGN